MTDLPSSRTRSADAPAGRAVAVTPKVKLDQLIHKSRTTFEMARKGRKMGHLTFTGATVAEVRANALAAAAILGIEAF